MTKAFFSVDVHGATGVWKKWLRTPEIYNAEVLMFCGDLTGKVLVPLVKQTDGTLLLTYGSTRYLKNEAEVQEVKSTLETGGIYVLECTPDELEEFKVSQKKVEETLTALIEERLRSWLDMLLQKIDVRKIQVLIMPGNDDPLAIDEIIKSYEDRGITYSLDKVLQIAGFETISLSESNPTPWASPRELEEKELAKKIEKLVNQLSDPSKSIFNFHPPPYGTNIDMAPKLKKDLSPIMGPGGVQTEHVGSKAVKDAVKKYQPLIGLHGHIHEAGGTDRVGRTPVINPGSEYGENVLRGFVISFSDKGVENYWKVEG
jgi:Icc-related predicted phosphoesterase